MGNWCSINEEKGNDLYTIMYDKFKKYYVFKLYTSIIKYSNIEAYF